jgi:hypothetical protein
MRLIYLFLAARMIHGKAEANLGSKGKNKRQIATLPTLSIREGMHTSLIPGR